jgi:hypothetical protein
LVPVPPLAGAIDFPLAASTNAAIAVINANIAILMSWLNLHTHFMPQVQHFHYFKNVPLDLYDTSVGVREDAVAAHVNENVQMPAKPVRTPIPNTCIVPCVCPGVTTTSTTTEEPTTTTTTTTTTEEPTTTTTTEDPNDQDVKDKSKNDMPWNKNDGDETACQLGHGINKNSWTNKCLILLRAVRRYHFNKRVIK